MESCSKKRKCQCHSIANQVGWHCIPLPKPKRNLVYFIFYLNIYHDLFFKGVYFGLRFTSMQFFMISLYLALFMRCNRHQAKVKVFFFLPSIFRKYFLSLFRPRCPGPRFRTRMASNSFPTCGSRQLCYRREHCNDYHFIYLFSLRLIIRFIYALVL